MNFHLHEFINTAEIYVSVPYKFNAVLSKQNFMPIPFKFDYIKFQRNKEKLQPDTCEAEICQTLSQNYDLH